VRNYGPRTSYINFDQIDGTNNICGVIANNGAGKSSIVQALLYGLFNVGKKIKREGAADSYVRVVIERMGITYMIERDKTVGVLVMADGQKIAAGNPKNVYAETIEPIVGKYDDFVRTCILRQKGADDFLYLTPTNRKKFLEELFDITCFDEYRRIVSEHISAANGSITALEKTLPIRTVDAITEGIRLINEQCAERQARHTKITNDIKACNESIRVLQSSMKPVNVAVPDASKLAAIKLEHRKATDTLISKHKLGSAQEIAHLHDKLIEKRGSIRANMPVLAGLAVLSNAEEVFKSCSARLAALDAPMESEECIARRDLATADMRVARDVLIAALTEAGVSAALINAAPNSVTISAADLEVQVSAARMSLDTNTFQYTQLRERIILIAMASGSVTDDELATKLTSIMDSVGALEKECAKYCSVLGYATDVDVDIIMSGIAALQAHIRSNEASVRAISVDPEIAALTFDAVMAAQKVNDDRIDRICRSAHYEACTHTLSILTARKEALLVVERESLAQIRAVSNSVALLEEECARIKGIDQCRFAEEDSLCSSCEHNRKVLHELIARYRGLQDKIDVMRGADAELVTQNAAISRRVADTRRELSKVSEDIAMLMDLEQKRMRASDYTSHISVLELRKTTAHMKQRVSRLEEFMQKQLSRMRHKHGYVELRDLLKGFATARSARAMAERSLTQLTAAQHEVQISELRKLRSDIEHNEERILLMRNCRHAQMSLEHASKKAALADIDTDIDAIETHKKIDTYLKRVAAAREAIKSNEATSEEIRIIDAEVDAMTRRLNGETAHLNKLTLDRSTDTAVLNNIKSVRARIDELLSERCIYAAYKKCIDDKKGIPFQILKQVITKFNEDAEVVSNMMGMPIISISIGRVDKSKVDTLNIMMRTPSGLVDILNTSGGEQECAAIAIRTVLCREYPSALADFFIIDEGFASLDDAAIAKVQTYMHNIKSRFRMIFMIAHQDALKDHIYTRFHIGGTPDAARLTHGDEIAATHARPSLDPAGIDDAEYKKVARGRPRKKPTAAEIDPFVLTASKSIVATPTSAPVEHATVKAPKPAAAKSAVQWTCDTCKTTIRLSSRAAHLTSKKHINLAKISGGTST
jgi:DNA repair exonuclease SbcCD ATPase subunit